MINLEIRIDALAISKASFSPEGRCIEIVGKLDGRQTSLVSARHSPRQFFGWLADSIGFIETEGEPRYLPAANSLAESIDLFYLTSSDEDLNAYDDELLNYRRRHDLRFGFRGIDVPSIILGRWRGVSTISSSDGKVLKGEIELGTLRDLF